MGWVFRSLNDGRVLNSGPDSYQPFPFVLASIQPRERVGRRLESFENLLLVAKPPRPHPVGQGRDRRLPSVRVVEDQQALGASALHQEVTFDARSGRPRVPGRNRRGATYDDAPS